ncbi:MAG: hypothetical protein KIT40_04420 [Nitrospira sp.]|nr:hypothetical protein [Nitrospira sp.]
MPDKLGVSYYTKAGKVQVSALWVVLSLLIIPTTPLGALAQHVGDLSPHPYSNNGIGNPFNSGGPYSLSPLTVPGRGPVAPTNPYTWSNVSPKPPGPAVLNRAELFGFPAPPPVPTVTTPGRGPYGITLPGNHPLAIGGR